VSIEVRDTGPGLSPELQARLFEPFFTTKGEGKGTGLGLWLSREIVTGFGGTIECASVTGKGTTFSVILPEADGASAENGKEGNHEKP
jgi:signal transduction histidine kinase